MLLTTKYGIETVHQYRAFPENMSSLLTAAEVDEDTTLTKPRLALAVASVFSASAYDMYLAGGETVGDYCDATRLRIQKNGLVAAVAAHALEVAASKPDGNLHKDKARPDRLQFMTGRILDPGTLDIQTDRSMNDAITLGAYAARLLDRSIIYGGALVGRHYIDEEAAPWDNDSVFAHAFDLGKYHGDILLAPLDNELRQQNLRIPVGIQTAYHQLGKYSVLLGHAANAGSDLLHSRTTPVTSILATNQRVRNVRPDDIENLQHDIIAYANEELGLGKTDISEQQIKVYDAVGRIARMSYLGEKRKGEKQLRQMFRHRASISVVSLLSKC